MSKEFIHKLTVIVEANLANETFGAEDLARQMGMSHSNLHRKLKTYSNQTISQFIREARLKKAKELLLNEDLTAAEIAYRVGFGSPTYFNKCFHEFFGYAPGELRKEEQWSEREIPVEHSPEKKSQTKILITLFAGLIILVPLSVFLFDKTKLLEASNLHEKTLAILPFKYMSDEAEKQYMADAMTGAIHHHLSKINDLTVISLTSVEQYQNTDKTIGEIGHELDVAYLLEGSYQKQGDDIRLIIQLRETKDEGLVWSQEYNRTWKDVFMVQSEVAETIARELHAVITPAEKQLIRRTPTSNLVAYDYYLRGKDALDKSCDLVTVRKAEKLFKKTLTLDSTYAMAYVGLAWTYLELHFVETFLSDSFLDSVLFLVNKAIAYDNQCTEAYFLKGHRYKELGNPALAMREFDSAIVLNPNDYNGYLFRAYLYREAMDDYVEAIHNNNEGLKRVRGEDLLYTLNSLGIDYLTAGFFDKAEDYFREVLKINSDSAWYLTNMSFLEFSKGNLNKCCELLERAAKNSPAVNYYELMLYESLAGRDKEASNYAIKYKGEINDTLETPYQGLHRLGYALSRGGRTTEAEDYLAKQLMLDKKSIEMGRFIEAQKVAYYELAAIYAFLNDKLQAYLYLDEFNKKRVFGSHWITFIKNDPMFNSIRQEERFQNIVKDMESKYQAEHERVGQWLAAQGML